MAISLIDLVGILGRFVISQRSGEICVRHGIPHEPPSVAYTDAYGMTKMPKTPVKIPNTL
jgi:hypothetical protein